ASRRLLELLALRVHTVSLEIDIAHARRIGSPTRLRDISLDKIRKECQGLLPAEIAGFGRDDPGDAFLHDIQFPADGDLCEDYRRLHFPRQIRVVELIRVANLLVRP